MRLFLLTSQYSLILIQQILTLWFLADFFLARDSLTANSFWKYNSEDVRQSDPVFSLADRVRSRYCNKKAPEDFKFDKLIFIVIDALGSYFIPSLSNINEQSKYSMPYIENLIINKEAIGFTARAATPTVTMPRIKALTSGTVPSFVDILYNLASDVSKFDDESVVMLAKAQNKSIVFYGDDTWLSLYDKSVFTRYKETYSFFASDYTTVDTNVTEAALPEINLNIIDWDYLILHYLGLDHIGHVFGSNHNQLINDKLVEMDNVLKIMHTSMAKRGHKTLMVICGDHGMSEEGNHGGGTPLETNTAMIFLPINQKLILERLIQKPVKQIDLAITLSILMGLPIPKSSKGVIIEPLLSGLATSEESKACASFENMMQLVELTNEFHNSSIKKDILDSLYNHLKNHQTSPRVTSQYSKIARKIQEILLEPVTSQSNPVMLLICLSLTTLLSVMAIKKISHRLLAPMSPKHEQFLCVLVFLVPILVQGSTDFIELEHYLWPVYSGTIFVIFVIVAITYDPKLFKNFDRLKVILLVVTFIFTCIWNRFRFGRDDTIMAKVILPFISIIILCNHIRQNSDLKTHNGIKALLVSSIIYITKLVDSSHYQDDKNVIYNAYLQRFAMLVIAIHTVSGLYNSDDIALTLRTIASGSMSVAFLLARLYNYPFLTAQIIMETSVNSLLNCSNLSSISRVLVYISFAQSAFYEQGNTNLFSTIDVRPAFFGQTGYNLFLSTVLVASATFSTQIYWYIKMLQRSQTLQSKSKVRENLDSTSLELIRNFVMMRNFLSLSYYMYVCMVLKNHLFIWSVISPRLVYHFVSNTVLLTTLLISSNIPKRIQKL